jgi:hypothetical protein
VVECLPSKCKALSSNSGITPHQKKKKRKKKLRKINKTVKNKSHWIGWLTSVILVTQEVEIRRTAI